MARTARLSALFVASTAIVALMAGPAGAGPRGIHSMPGNVIEVFPGRHALAKALGKAQPGDTLNMHAGRYKDSVTISKAGLSIVAAGDGAVTVDGRCLTTTTISVRASDVVIEGITVVGGTFFEIDYEHVGGGDVVGDTVMDTCGAAEYGVNIYDTLAVNVAKVTASGFSDSGIYVGSITRLGGETLYVQSNSSNGNEVGIIVEFSAMQHIVVDGNDVSDNSTGGIALQGSANIVVRNNIADGNGTYGILADGGSNNNLIKRNEATGNQYDLVNLGAGNCYRHNHYVTHQGPIGC
jgi:parallel beta-helix repeat protein